MCEVFEASPSAYYEWERQQESDHARRDGELLAAIRRLFGEFHGRYGAGRCGSFVYVHYAGLVNTATCSLDA